MSERAVTLPGSALCEPALALRQVTVELAGRTVLYDVDLRLETGELVGLLGPNGAGKTTLLRTALGLLKPSRGGVTVSGQPVRAGRVAIGYVPQWHEFAWELPITVGELVMTGRRNLGVIGRPGQGDREAVGEALDRAAISDLKNRPIGQLSGGQRQRALVARALAQRPRVLLLDEPYTGLDMPTQAVLGELFAELAHEHAHAVLMTTHDIAFALHGADRIGLIDRSIIAAGSAATLARDPRAWARTFGLSADSPLLRVLETVR